MKLTGISAVAAILLAVGAGMAQAEDTKSPDATVNNVLGIDLSLGGETNETRATYFGSLTPVQQVEVRAKCTALAAATAANDADTAQAKTFCASIPPA